jgi:hypothetical protein
MSAQRGSGRRLQRFNRMILTPRQPQRDHDAIRRVDEGRPRPGVRQVARHRLRKVEILEKQKQKQKQKRQRQSRREQAQVEGARQDIHSGHDSAWGTSPSSLGEVKRSSDEAKLISCPECGLRRRAPRTLMRKFHAAEVTGSGGLLPMAYGSLQQSKPTRRR